MLLFVLFVCFVRPFVCIVVDLFSCVWCFCLFVCLGCVLLCCVVLSCGVPCLALPCHAALRLAVQCRAVPCCSVPCPVVSWRIVLCCVVRACWSACLFVCLFVVFVVQFVYMFLGCLCVCCFFLVAHMSVCMYVCMCVCMHTRQVRIHRSHSQLKVHVRWNHDAKHLRCKCGDGPLISVPRVPLHPFPSIFCELAYTLPLSSHRAFDES